MTAHANSPRQSLTVTAFSPEGEFTAASGSCEPSLLVRTGPPSDGPEGPLRLAVVEHERYLPAIKHVGEGAKTHYLRKAVAQGFDDGETATLARVDADAATAYTEHVDRLIRTLTTAPDYATLAELRGEPDRAERQRSILTINGVTP